MPDFPGKIYQKDSFYESELLRLHCYYLNANFQVVEEL